MATTHSKTARAKSNDDTIKVDWSAVWEQARQEAHNERTVCDEYLAQGYRYAHEVAEEFGFSKTHVTEYCKRRGWSIVKVKAYINGGTREVNLVRPPV
jgi:hypothetical protein